jgi:acetyl esterase/lipase
MTMNPIRAVVSVAWLAVLIASPLGDARAADGSSTATAPSPGAPPFRIDPPKPLPTPAEPDAIPLYAGVAPGSERASQVEAWEDFLGQRIVRNVVRPVLLPVLPKTGTGNGRAVVVAPGGGYQFFSIDSEGYSVAKRLAERGYAAFVLKYRTEKTPAPPAEFFAATAAVFGKLGKATLPDNPLAIADLAAAVQLVQRDAAKWKLDPAKVGVVGFSAGARTVIRLVEQRSRDAKPQNVALIYPPMEKPVSGGARPPMYLAIAVDDPLFAQGGLKLLESWLAESRAVECHLYSGGNHGFGMRPQGTTSDYWIESYLHWLDAQK